MHGNFRRELTFDSGREMRITQNWGHKTSLYYPWMQNIRVWWYKLEFLGFTPETDIDQWVRHSILVSRQIGEPSQISWAAWHALLKWLSTILATFQTGCGVCTLLVILHQPLQGFKTSASPKIQGVCAGNNIRRFIGSSNIKVSELFENALGMKIVPSKKYEWDKSSCMLHNHRL